MGGRGGRAADVHIPHSSYVAGAVIVLASVFPLWSGRGMSFRFDDYSFAFDRFGWGPAELLRPINEHWSTLTILVFKLLFPVVGLRSYAPYLVVLVALHATATFLLFLLVRRHAGPALALGASLAFALLGQGADNFFWATQINFAGSASAGLLALLLVESELPSNRALASLALLASLMFSGVGLLYVVVIAVWGISRRNRRRVVAIMIAPVLAYSAWFAAYGARASNFHTSMLTHPEQLPRLPAFVAYGIITAVTEVYELPFLASIPIIATAVFALRRGGLTRNENRMLILGSATAVITFYILTGLERLGSQPTASRYVYAVAPLILIITAASLGGVALSTLRLPALLALMLLTSVNVLVINASADSLRAEAGARRDTLQFVALFGRTPGADGEATFSPRLLPVVTPARYLLATDRLGSPFEKVTWDTLRARHSPWTEMAAEAMFHPHLVFRGTPAIPPSPSCEAVGAHKSDVVLPIGPPAITVLPGTTGGILYRLSLRGYSALGPLLDNWTSSAAEASIRPSASTDLTWDLHLSTTSTNVMVCSSGGTAPPS